MKNYLELLRDIYENGYDSDDRTGVGTRSTFGNTLKFDLREGFPIVTSKFTWFKGCKYELKWYLEGSTNVKYLVDNDVHIWDSWRKPYNYRYREGFIQNEPAPVKYYEIDKEKVLEESKSVELKTEIDKELYEFWKEHVEEMSENWSDFATFLEEVKQVPHWWYKEHDPENFVLSKLYYLSSLYSVETCIWVSKEEEEYNKNIYHCRLTPIPDGELGPVYGSQWRNWGGTYDQLQRCVDSIRNNPGDRRMVVSAWNVGEIEQMALPPCHMFFQFYVAGEYLDIYVYQRSADMFLGVPFDIAEYALLLEYIARITGKTARFMTYAFGNTHIYKNHFAQVEELLTRTPKKLPKLVIEGDDYKELEDFDPERVRLEGYEHCGKLQAPVAV